MSVPLISVDATRIVQTLEATSVPATLVMKSRMITEPVLVRRSTYVCIFGKENPRIFCVIFDIACYNCRN